MVRTASLARVVALLALACAAVPATAATTPSDDVPSTPSAVDARPDAASIAQLRNRSTLFVELIVNQRSVGDLVEVEDRSGHVWIDAALLRQAGVAVAAVGAIDLNALPDIRTRYDAATQRLMVDVPPALLPVRRISGARMNREATSVETGAVLNYDLFVQTAGGHTSAALLTEQRLFARLGTLSNTGVWRSGAELHNGYIRYDTRAILTDERRAMTLTLGDAITRALPWSRATRIGGVQIARAFRIRPDLITAPLPSFAGQAAVPSGVDLFIDGQRQQSMAVEPGRFVIDTVPIVNGAGEARIVTTDAVGRQIATVIPFYVAPELLKRGTLDFSVESGALRRRYGVANFAYGRWATSGSARYGITDHLTIEGHGEVARDLRHGGIGVAWAPGLWGSIHASATTSTRQGRSGRAFTIGYSYASRRFGLGLDHQERSDGYADLASFDLANWRGSMRTDRVSLTTHIGRVGTLGAGYIAGRSANGTKARIVSMSLSLPVGNRASLFAAVDHAFDRRATSAQLRLVLPLGGGDSVASVGADYRSDARSVATGSVARAVPTQGGLGYAIDAAFDDGGAARAQASATHRSAAVSVEAGAAAAYGRQSAWVGATGAVALLGGKLRFANALPDAFAIVATGSPDIPVYYENQLMGRTDRHGDLFVPRVTAYHAARFAIDPINLPSGAIAEVVEARAALPSGSGAVIRMPVRAERSVVARLVDPHGTPLPVGTSATRDDGRSVTIGWDGMVYTDLSNGPVTITAAVPAGACRVRLSRPAMAAADLTDLGTMTCR